MPSESREIISNLTGLITRVLEPAILGFMLLAFWYRSPARDQWLWLLALIPAVWFLRWLSVRRLWTRTLLDPSLLLLVGLCVLNVYLAPYRRSSDVGYSFFVLMARPLLGIALIVYFVEFARQRRGLGGLLATTLVLGLFVAVVALGSSQWTTKSDQLRFLIDPLPRFAESLEPLDAGGGFNVNEIGGALAWICPLMAGLAAYYYFARNKILCVLAIIAFAFAFLALFLGQSRFAIGGVLIALAIMVWLLIPRLRWRALAWGVLVAIAVLELLIMRNAFGAASLAERDEESVSARFDIWVSALHIMGDYPVTGVGLNMYRDGRVRQLYPVPTFSQPVLPHTHQEWLQIGTDIGFPGLVAYLALQASVAWMVFRSYRDGDQRARAVIVGAGGGLIAHAVFGLGDAIPIWDRFAFLMWWLIALVAAQDFLVTQGKTDPPEIT